MAGTPDAAAQQRRPTVLMVHDYPPLSGGGLAASVQELARLLRDDLSFRVLSSRLVDHFADDTTRSAAPGGPEWTLAGPLAALLRAREADIVVVHWTFSFRWLSTLLLVAAPSLRKPTICVMHTAPAHCEYNRLRRVPRPARRGLFALVRRAANRCTAVVALSATHAAELAAAGIHAEHILPFPVTPNGHADDRAERPLETVAVVGELSELKGADAVARLLPVLTKEFRVRIVGRGSWSGRLAAAAATLPPHQRRRVLVSDRVDPALMPRVYEEIDCLLVVSRAESQSRVTLEAMLAGVIVVARKTGGVGDPVAHGATGFLVDPDDPESVRATLLRLAREPAEVDLVRRRARALATGAFGSGRRDWQRFLLQVGR